MLLGITGPIGCGKSTAAAMTKELGALEVIDADRVTHELMGPDSELGKEIANEFGPEFLKADGSVDRTRLGRLVFGNAEKLRCLESLVHPRVRKSINQRLDALGTRHRSGVVTIEAIRLLDTPYADQARAVWVVACNEDVQVRRLVEIRGYAPEEADRRMQAQPSFDSPEVTAHITNDGSVEDLRAQVTKAWRGISSANRE